MKIVRDPNGVLLADADLLVVGTASATLPTDLDQAMPGLAAALGEDKFEGKPGSSVAVRPLGAIAAKWVLVVGTGTGSAADLRLAGGAAGNFARGKGHTTLRLALGLRGLEAEAAAIEGLVAGNYRFDKYLAEDTKTAPIETVTVLGESSEEGLKLGQILGDARSLARDLVNGPAADIYPESLAAVAEGIASERVSVEVWDAGKVKDAGMGGITAVGQASDKPPVFVHMVYKPKGESRAEVALVGKGVTFDSGGLSLKPTSGMLTMRCDMGGSAAVVGAMSALEALDLPITVHGIFGAAENMVNGNSYKLGDVLTIYNGKTVEVLNTDAEGRLVLADCLSYASKLEGVSHIVDLATLTGAAVVALGEHYSACYANDEDFRKTLVEAAEAGGEAYWPMPLEPLYNELIKGEWGQIKNVGGRAAGSITAALFLQNFVAEGKTWSHLDIAGPAFLGKPERHLGKGGTGAGVPGLLAWLRSL